MALIGHLNLNFFQKCTEKYKQPTYRYRNNFLFGEIYISLRNNMSAEIANIYTNMGSLVRFGTKNYNPVFCSKVLALQLKKLILGYSGNYITTANHAYFLYISFFYRHYVVLLYFFLNWVYKEVA